jgi:hypothetical protein
MRSLWRQYRIELIALIIALIGLFLLLESFEIQTFVGNALTVLGDWAYAALVAAVEATIGYFRTFSFSDLVGLTLAFLPALFITWRARWHFLHNPRWTSHACPWCGGPIVRIHRTWLDHAMSRALFLSLYRFRCRNPECGWSGRRYGRHHRHRSQRPTEHEILDTSDIPHEDPQ